MKVLLCVDDDSQYEAVLAAPQRLLSLGSNDEILVAHAIATLRWLPLKGNSPGWAGTERQIFRRVDDFLQAAAAALRDRGMSATTLCLEGDVASELLQAAHENDADIVVAGAIGQARGQDFLVGSIAEKLESAAERDLLLIRGEAGLAPHGGIRVAVAVDDTEASFHAIERFIEKFRLDHASIEIVHVIRVPPPRIDAAPEGTQSKSAVPAIVRERADHAINRARELFSVHGLQPRLALRHGAPAREVLAAAKAFDAHLVVVGHGDRTTTERGIGWRGTVSKRVAHHAPCSVFIAASTHAANEPNPKGES
jgi:nucleotide-binding universal stress UspA family protein